MQTTPKRVLKPKPTAKMRIGFDMLHKKIKNFTKTSDFL